MVNSTGVNPYPFERVVTKSSSPNRLPVFMVPTTVLGLDLSRKVLKQWLCNRIYIFYAETPV